MCMADSGEYNTFSRTVEPRARKAHRCDECGRTIEAGERYRRSSALFDGRFDEFKMCWHCRVAAQWLEKNCDGYLTQGVHEDIREHIDEYRGVYVHTLRPLKRLDIGMSRKWKIRRGPKAGQLMRIPNIPPVVGAHT